MKNFFKYQSDYPSGSGFFLFGKTHMIWLIVILVVCVVSTKWIMKKDKQYRNKMNKILGCIMPVMGLYRDFTLLLTHHFAIGYLPFHLCSMALWIGAVYVITKNRYVGVIYVWLCVPGAIAALLFPDWTMYPFFNYMHIHAFLAHGCIVTLGMWLFFTGEICPSWKEIWMPLSFALTGSIILYPFNAYFYTNFWFLNEPSVGSPLITIYHSVGKHWYLLGYGIFCVFILILWKLFLHRMQTYTLNKTE